MFDLVLLLRVNCWKLLAAAHDFPGRCICHDTIKFIRGQNMSDFQVLERRPGCDKTEVM